MKKALIVALIVGLMAMLIPATALAANFDTGDQIIQGDITGEIVLTCDVDMTGLVWTVGDANEDTEASAMNIKSNVDFDVKAQSDRAVLEEYDPVTTNDYVVDGKVLQTALQMHVDPASGETGSSSDFADVVLAQATTFLTDAAETNDDGRNFDTFTKQAIDYGDPVAEGTNLYRCTITWTASENV
jgi:hypothetical protein